MKRATLIIAAVATCIVSLPAMAASEYSKRPAVRHSGRVIYHGRNGEGPYYISKSTGQKQYLQSPYYSDNGNYPLWAQKAFDGKAGGFR